MRSLQLWHFIVTACVVMTLVALSIVHIMRSEAQWEQVSARGLQHKINVGLEQIYWQWQSEGRPEEIMYRPEHVKQAIKIKMLADGKPDIEVSQAACKEFLNWFVQDLSMDSLVTVKATAQNGAQAQDGNDDTAQLACRYTIANHSFAYHVHDAQLRN